MGSDAAFRPRIAIALALALLKRLTVIVVLIFMWEHILKFWPL